MAAAAAVAPPPMTRTDLRVPPTVSPSPFEKAQNARQRRGTEEQWRARGGEDSSVSSTWRRSSGAFTPLHLKVRTPDVALEPLQSLVRALARPRSGEAVKVGETHNESNSPRPRLRPRPSARQGPLPARDPQGGRTFQLFFKLSLSSPSPSAALRERWARPDFVEGAPGDGR